MTGNLLWELLQGADRAAQARFKRMQAQYGRGRATLWMTLIGACWGGMAMSCPYGLAAFILMWQVRANNPMLVMMFLLVYVLLGMVQGAWLGAACGLSVALTAQRQRHKAGLTCWVGSLPYVALLAWFFYTAACTHRDAVKLLILAGGLPLLWAGVLLLIGARLLSRP